MKKIISYESLKLVMDKFLVIFLLPFFIIIIPFIIILIILDSKGSPFFIQTRVGKNEKLFKIIKFRTMYLDTPNISTEDLEKLNVNTITKVGNFLRRTSLDELPQIINVLVGEMSFVGPRPALPTQIDVIKLRRRHGVNYILPGITGLAQVRGRDNLNTEEKCELDRVYAKNASIYLDLRILFIETVRVVLSNRGNK